MTKLRKRALDIEEDLDHFKLNYWYFDSKNLLKMNSILSKQEQDIFFMDVRKCTMTEEAQKYFYGMAKFYLGQDLLKPELGFKQIV